MGFPVATRLFSGCQVVVREVAHQLNLVRVKHIPELKAEVPSLQVRIASTRGHLNATEMSHLVECAADRWVMGVCAAQIDDFLDTAAVRTHAHSLSHRGTLSRRLGVGTESDTATGAKLGFLSRRDQKSVNQAHSFDTPSALAPITGAENTPRLSPKVSRASADAATRTTVWRFSEARRVLQDGGEQPSALRRRSGAFLSPPAPCRSVSRRSRVLSRRSRVLRKRLLGCAVRRLDS